MDGGPRVAVDAGRIQPEAGFVAEGIDGVAVVVLGTGFQNGADVAAIGQRRFRDQQPRQRGDGIVQPVEGGIGRARHEERLGTRVAQHVVVIVLGQARIDADRHHPGLDGPQEDGGPVDVVVQAEHDAVFAPHPDGVQATRKMVHPPGQLAIGDGHPLVDEHHLVGPAGLQVALQQVVGSVVVARNAREHHLGGVFGAWGLVVHHGAPGS